MRASTLDEHHANKRRPFRRRFFKEKTVLRMIQLSILAFALGAAALPASAETQSTDAKRCQQLITTFDRVSPDFDHNASHRNRDLGEAECSKGNYAAGEKLLEMALRSFGYSPS